MTQDIQLEAPEYFLDDSDVNHILEDLIESNLDVGDEKQIIKIGDKPPFLTCFFHALQASTKNFNENLHF